MISCDLLTAMSSHSYYSYIGVAEMLFGYVGATAPEKSRNSDSADSKSLDISHSDDGALYTASTKKRFSLQSKNT